MEVIVLFSLMGVAFLIGCAPPVRDSSKDYANRVACEMRVEKELVENHMQPKLLPTVMKEVCGNKNDIKDDPIGEGK